MLHLPFLSLRQRSASDRLLLELVRDNAESRAALHRRWRRKLQRAEKRPIHIIENPRPADQKHPLLSKRARRMARRFGNWTMDPEPAHPVPPSRGAIWVRAGYRDKVVAHMLFVYGNDRAHYRIGYTRPEGIRVNANHLVLWRATRYLAARGVRTVDLGPVCPRMSAGNRIRTQMGARRQSDADLWQYWHPFRLDPGEEQSLV
jgi:hypothetical protein